MLLDRTERQLTQPAGTYFPWCPLQRSCHRRHWKWQNRCQSLYVNNMADTGYESSSGASCYSKLELEQLAACNSGVPRGY